MALLTGDFGCGEGLPNRPLIYQPELRHPVARIPQLNQQIAVRADLGPFTAEETESYITVRMGAAAHRTDVSMKVAMGVIYEQRRWIGRLIEAHCDQCVHAGTIGHVLEIGYRLVQRVGQVI
jgi:type II secretory pathway predicted ATPase ExeA